MKLEGNTRRFRHIVVPGIPEGADKASSDIGPDPVRDPLNDWTS